MSSADRRRQQQTALHTVANPPAPLLLLPASQSLTFSADDVQLPGMLMPMPQAAASDQLTVGNICRSLSLVYRHNGDFKFRLDLIFKL